MGRKNSELTDLTFPNEKSVSRTHCRLRLISLTGREEEGEDGDDGRDARDGVNKNEPLSPRNEEEKKLCEASIDGLAIVLDDLGR